MPAFPVQPSMVERRSPCAGRFGGRCGAEALAKLELVSAPEQIAAVVVTLGHKSRAGT